MKTTTQLLVEPYLAYKEFLDTCKNKVYAENEVLHKHHIIPKCLGGNNSKFNLVKLSVDDHITAHLMLASCFDAGSKEQISNLRSARVLNKKSIKDKDVLYEIIKTYLGENNPFYGKYHTEESIDKMRKATKENLTGLDYEQRYGDQAELQKRVRSEANKKVWDLRTAEERKAIAQKTSEKLKGKPAWNKGVGIQIKINGKCFKSIKEAANYYNTSVFLLKKNYNVLYMEDV